VTRFLAAAPDLTSIRFAWSPVWETHLAVRLLVIDEGRQYHRSWQARVARQAAGIDLSGLFAVNPPSGPVPDFLTPPPSGPAPAFAAQLAQVRATPVAQVEQELRQCQAGELAGLPSRRPPRSRAQWSAAYAGVLDRLVADPAAARDRLAGELATAWESLIEPYWPRLRALLDADISFRAGQLAGHGLRELLGGIDTRISWAEGVIEIDDGLPGEFELRGRGLVLMPSAYVWPLVTGVTDEPWQPTIVYPARGIGNLWQQPAPAPGTLVRLLGRTRAQLLAGLDEPASTSALAARHGLSASGTSAHLTAMRDAGLLATTRHGHEVRYGRTRLGTELSQAGRP
jgi:hypothetical protein